MPPACVAASAAPRSPGACAAAGSRLVVLAAQVVLGARPEFLGYRRRESQFADSVPQASRLRTTPRLWNIPGSMPVHASWLYAHNVLHYVTNLFKQGLDKPDLDDEIVRHSLVTHQGKIVHQGALKAMSQR